jgi:hypothetical protein
MTRLATIIVVAMATMLLAASSAFAKAPAHTGQPVKDQNDTAALVAVAGLGVLVAGSALVPLERRRRSAVTKVSARPAAARG